MRMIWWIWLNMRHQEYEWPDWVLKRSYQCDNLPDRHSYLPYQGWYIDSHTKFSQVPVFHDDFHQLLSFISVSSSTLPSPKNMKLSHPSLLLHAMIMSWHHVQHTPSTASSYDQLFPAPSQFLNSQCMYSTLYIPTITSWPINRVSAPVAPPFQSTASKYSPPISIDHALQGYLPTHSFTASKLITEFTQSQPLCASPNSLDPSLQVHPWVPSIPGYMCISNLAWSWLPSAPLSSLALSLQVLPQSHSIMVSQYIVREWWRVYGDTGVTEVNRLMGSI